MLAMRPLASKVAPRWWRSYLHEGAAQPQLSLTSPHAVKLQESRFRNYIGRELPFLAANSSFRPRYRSTLFSLVGRFIPSSDMVDEVENQDVVSNMRSSLKPSRLSHRWSIASAGTTASTRSSATYRTALSSIGTFLSFGDDQEIVLDTKRLKRSSWYHLLESKGLLPDQSTEQNWSGRGEHAEFKPNEAGEISRILEDPEFLGSSSTAIVQKVRCRRIMLARKTIRCNRHFKRTDALREVEHLKRLPHSHIVRVIGTYTFKQELAILLYPATEYNLQSFMDTIVGSGIESEDEKRINFFRLHALAGFFACLANTIEYLHRKLTRHMDIKPGNFLVKCISNNSSLRVDYKIYIADFGITRSYEGLEIAETDSPTNYTHKYAAPEVVEQLPRGFPSDIFSLGCVFVEMLTTLVENRLEAKSELLSILKSEYFGSSYHENIPKVIAWLEEMCWTNVDSHVFALLLPLTSHIAEMLDSEPVLRPSASSVASWANFNVRDGCCSEVFQSESLSVDDQISSEDDNAMAHNFFSGDSDLSAIQDGDGISTQSERSILYPPEMLPRLLDRERAYIKRLELLHELLDLSAKISSTHKAHLSYLKIPDLLQYHHDLLQDLQLSDSSGDSWRTGLSKFAQSYLRFLARDGLLEIYQSLMENQNRNILDTLNVYQLIKTGRHSPEVTEAIAKPSHITWLISEPYRQFLSYNSLLTSLLQWVADSGFLEMPRGVNSIQEASSRVVKHVVARLADDHKQALEHNTSKETVDQIRQLSSPESLLMKGISRLGKLLLHGIFDVQFVEDVTPCFYIPQPIALQACHVYLFDSAIVFLQRHIVSTPVKGLRDRISTRQKSLALATIHWQLEYIIPTWDINLIECPTDYTCAINWAAFVQDQGGAMMRRIVITSPRKWTAEHWSKMIHAAHKTSDSVWTDVKIPIGSLGLSKLDRAAEFASRTTSSTVEPSDYLTESNMS